MDCSEYCTEVLLLSDNCHILRLSHKSYYVQMICLILKQGISFTLYIVLYSSLSLPLFMCEVFDSGDYV